LQASWLHRMGVDPTHKGFLHHIEGKNVGATPQPKVYWENNIYLMDSSHLKEFSLREKIYIHRCRIHLQVETLSDISTASGMHIHKAWIFNHKEKPSKSTNRWPRQDSPSNMAWSAWRKFIQKLSNRDSKLRTRLGGWIIQINNSRHTSPRMTS
jgi:hypothetical protein